MLDKKFLDLIRVIVYRLPIVALSSKKSWLFAEYILLYLFELSITLKMENFISGDAVSFLTTKNELGLVYF